MKNSIINPMIVSQCRQKLVLMKEDVLNRIRSSRLEISVHDKMSGDEADQTVAQALENEFATKQNRLRMQLMEIENALARIQKGAFGICEETLEPIEEDRLLAIPFTRLSIEGAELREAMEKRFAR